EEPARAALRARLRARHAVVLRDLLGTAGGRALQPLQFLQRCGRSDPLLRPGLSAGGKPRLGCHCYAHQPLAAPARKLAGPTPAFDRLSRAAAIARPRRRAWFRRVSSARLRASSDALCARTIESPRWPLAPLASAAAPTSLVQAS